jgi:hypothetical protein
MTLDKTTEMQQVEPLDSMVVELSIFKCRRRDVENGDDRLSHNLSPATGG